jgi:hypothetical protein
VPGGFPAELAITFDELHRRVDTYTFTPASLGRPDECEGSCSSSDRRERGRVTHSVYAVRPRNPRAATRLCLYASAEQPDAESGLASAAAVTRCDPAHGFVIMVG